MADQWGRKIWLAIKELTGAPIPGSSAQQLVEANYDRRDENGVEVPGVPDGDGNIPQPPVDTSFLQKIYDVTKSLDPNAIRLGLVPGIQMKSVYGYHQYDDVNWDPPSDIWSAGAYYFGFRPSDNLRSCVQSSSDYDTVQGEGVQQIEVFGLDLNYEPVGYIVDMDGKNCVFIDSLIRCDFMRVKRVGFRGKGEGIIFVRKETPATSTMARLVLDDTRSEKAFFTVPSGKTAIVLKYKLQSFKDDSTISNINVILQAKKLNGLWQIFERALVEVRQVSTGDTLNEVILPEKTDVKATLSSSYQQSLQIGKLVPIICRIDYMLVDNSLFDVSNIEYTV